MKMSENDYIAEYVKEKMPEITHTFDFAMWKMMRSFKNFAEYIGKLFKKGEEDDQECGHRSDVCREEGDEEHQSDVCGGKDETEDEN